MRIGEFRGRCLELAAGCPAHRPEYVEQNLYRLYKTYEICRGVLPAGARVLSAGAGVAYLERLLAEETGARFVVLDFFAGGAGAAAEEYARFGAEPVACDLTSQWELPEGGEFDAAFSFEVLEHLPMAPAAHFAGLLRYVKPGGLLLASTPNLARLENVVKLVRGKAVLAEPELAFGAVSAANQHVHRREYTAREIEQALAQAGAAEVKTHFTFQQPPQKGSLKRRTANLVKGLVPRWRGQLICVARAGGVPEVRGQRSEVRDQRSEVRGQRAGGRVER